MDDDSGTSAVLEEVANPGERKLFGYVAAARWDPEGEEENSSTSETKIDAVVVAYETDYEVELGCCTWHMSDRRK